MKTSNFADRLRQAINDNGFSQADLLTRCKKLETKYNCTISKSSISLYLSGTNSCKPDVLAMLSEVLGVPEEWLLGYDSDTRYTQEEQKLIECWRQADQSEKETIAFILRNYGMHLSSKKEEIA